MAHVPRYKSYNVRLFRKDGGRIFCGRTKTLSPVFAVVCPGRSRTARRRATLLGGHPQRPTPDAGCGRAGAATGSRRRAASSATLRRSLWTTRSGGQKSPITPPAHGVHGRDGLGRVRIGTFRSSMIPRTPYCSCAATWQKPPAKNGGRRAKRPYPSTATSCRAWASSGSAGPSSNSGRASPRSSCESASCGKKECGYGP